MFRSERPAPLDYVWTIDAVLVRIVTAGDLHVSESLLRVRSDSSQLVHPVNRINSQSEPVYLVVDCQFHRRIDISSFLVATHVKVLVVGPIVGKSVNQPRVAVKIENDWRVHGKQTVKVAIAKPVWMVPIGLQLEEVNDIDEANLQIRKFIPQQRRCRQGFLSWNITGTGHHQIWILTLIVARLPPNANAFCAVYDGCLHVQILQMKLLITHDYIDVVFTA